MHQERALFLLNLPTSLHNLANTLLFMQPLFKMRAKPAPALSIKVVAPYPSFTYEPESNQLRIELLLSETTPCSQIERELLHALHFPQSPLHCVYSHFGSFLPETKSLSFTFFNQAEQPEKPDSLTAIITAFDANESAATELTVEGTRAALRIPEELSSRALWVTVVAGEKELVGRRLFIVRDAGLEQQNRVIKAYRKEESCFLVGVNCFEHLRPVLVPKVKLHKNSERGEGLRVSIGSALS